jgi:hypothetical protein
MAAQVMPSGARAKFGSYIVNERGIRSRTIARPTSTRDQVGDEVVRG